MLLTPNLGGADQLAQTWLEEATEMARMLQVVGWRQTQRKTGPFRVLKHTSSYFSGGLWLQWYIWIQRYKKMSFLPPHVLFLSSSKENSEVHCDKLFLNDQKGSPVTPNSRRGRCWWETLATNEAAKNLLFEGFEQAEHPKRVNRETKKNRRSTARTQEEAPASATCFEGFGTKDGQFAPPLMEHNREMTY